MSKLGMIVVGTVKSGKREELQALFDSLLGPAARDNAKQEVVVWCADGNDPNRFFVFELYESAEAMQANATNPAFAAYMEKAMPLLAAPPLISFGATGFTKGV